MKFVPKATIDNNSIVALDKRDRGEPLSVKDQEIATAMDGIISLAKAGEVEIILPAIAASERQQQGRKIADFDEFRDKLKRLGIEPAMYAMSEFRLGMSFLGYATLGFAGPEWSLLQREIQQIIHPSMDWDDTTNKNWLNRYCDISTIHAHLQANGDLFITDDNHFLVQHKKTELLLLGANMIASAKDSLDVLKRQQVPKSQPLDLPQFDGEQRCTYIPQGTYNHYRRFRCERGLPKL